MDLQIKTLPIIEHWTCSGCGQCCHGNVVPLDDRDLTRLRGQNWDQHPDFKGRRVTKRSGLLRPKYRLAQREDGGCVFLDDDGLCRIHKEFGFDEKPLICRMYPLQMVPMGKESRLTLRRSCPTVAKDDGEEIREHLAAAKALAAERPALVKPSAPPAIDHGVPRSWQTTQLVLRAIERLLSDQRFPLVRRLVHGLQFCDLLEQCRLKKMGTGQINELVGVLADAAPTDATDFFQRRQAPSKSAAVMMRQFLAEYLRLHPLYVLKPAWNSRWKVTLAAWSFLRGSGEIVRLHPDFPQRRFEEVEQREFGHLDTDLQKPLVQYFETMVASAQYAVVHRPGWTIIEKFRALAMVYPAAMWMLRYFVDVDSPSTDQVVDVITTIDRGQGYGPLTGRQHRRRIANLHRLGEMERLVVWYAR